MEALSIALTVWCLILSRLHQLFALFKIDSIGSITDGDAGGDCELLRWNFDDRIFAMTIMQTFKFYNNF